MKTLWMSSSVSHSLNSRSTALALKVLAHCQGASTERSRRTWIRSYFFKEELPGSRWISEELDLLCTHLFIEASFNWVHPYRLKKPENKVLKKPCFISNHHLTQQAASNFLNSETLRKPLQSTKLAQHQAIKTPSAIL